MSPILWPLVSSAEVAETNTNNFVATMRQIPEADFANVKRLTCWKLYRSGSSLLLYEERAVAIPKCQGGFTPWCIRWI